MPVCGYVVVPQPGAVEAVARTLSDLDRCEVLRAENAELLLLVTASESLQGDADLRRRVQAVEGIDALMMTFGEIDPDAPEADPVQAGRRRSRSHDRIRLEDLNP